MINCSCPHCQGILIPYNGSIIVCAFDKKTFGMLIVKKVDNNILCRNPTLAKCGGEAQHLEKLEVGSLPGLLNVQSSTARPKTPRIEVFLVSLEGLET
jgi:hypothetical protein